MMDNHFPIWKHYLLVLRNEMGNYSVEFENDFTDFEDKVIIARVKVYIPQSYVYSVGISKFLHLIERSFYRMQRPSCVSPQAILMSLKRNVQSIKCRLYKIYGNLYKDIKSLLNFFFEKVYELLRQLWMPSKSEYWYKRTQKKILRHDYAILSSKLVG